MEKSGILYGKTPASRRPAAERTALQIMEENRLFEKVSVPKAFFTLTIPLVLARIVGLVYNMADTYFVTKLGTSASVRTWKQFRDLKAVWGTKR